jgi:radical SAM superfamily enzyme YgiQ (UPF0313 family)
MKKVLLVNVNTEKAPYPVPPIGMCIIAQSIEDHYEVEVYDGMFDEGRNLEAVVYRFQPDFIGCSIRNIDSMSIQTKDFFLDKVNEVFIKPLKKYSAAPIILGGSGFSIYPYETLDYLDIDLGIIGEGEETFKELLMALENKTDLTTIRGVACRDFPEELRVKKFTSPHPKTKYHSGIFKYIDFTAYEERGAYSIQTKRGCAHKCIYCTYPVIEGTKFRSRTAVDIVDEIENVFHKLGNICFEFVDSTFNDPKGHAEAICHEIIRRKLKLRLRTMGINPDNTSEELFRLMKEAGFTQIDSTPDTASEVMLKNLGKNFSLSRLEEMAVQLKKADIPTMWFFVFGGPGETYRTIDETFAFIEKFISEKDLVYITTSLRIYPNTMLHDIAIAEHMISEEDNLLMPVFFENPKFPHEEISRYLREKIGKKHNILFTSDARPSPAMMQEAMQIRKEQGIDEPMFRILLRLRKIWIEEGKI